MNTSSLANVTKRLALQLLDTQGSDNNAAANTASTTTAPFKLPSTTPPSTVQQLIRAPITRISTVGPHPALLWSGPFRAAPTHMVVVLPATTLAAPDTRSLLDSLLGQWIPRCIAYDLADGGTSLQAVRALCSAPDVGAVLCGLPPPQVDLHLHDLLLRLRFAGLAVFQLPCPGFLTQTQAFPQAPAVLSRCHKLLLPRPSTCRRVRQLVVHDRRVKLAVWTSPGLEHVRQELNSTTSPQLKARCANVGCTLEWLDVRACVPITQPVSMLRAAHALRGPSASNHGGEGMATHHVLMLSPLSTCGHDGGVDEQLAEWMQQSRYRGDVASVTPFAWMQSAPEGLTQTELYIAHLLHASEKPVRRLDETPTLPSGGTLQSGYTWSNGHVPPFFEVGAHPQDPAPERVHPAARPPRAMGTGPHVLALLLPDAPAVVATCSPGDYNRVCTRFSALLSLLLAHPDVSCVHVDDDVGRLVLDDTWQRVEADIQAPAPVGPQPVQLSGSTPTPARWSEEQYTVREVDTALVRALTHGNPRLVVVTHAPGAGATAAVTRAMGFAQRVLSDQGTVRLVTAYVSARYANGQPKPHGQILASLCSQLSDADADHDDDEIDMTTPPATLAYAQQALRRVCASLCGSATARALLVVDDVDAVTRTRCRHAPDWLAPLLEPPPPAGTGLPLGVQVALCLRDTEPPEADKGGATNIRQQDDELLQLLAASQRVHQDDMWSALPLYGDPLMPTGPEDGQFPGQLDPAVDEHSAALLQWLTCPTAAQQTQQAASSVAARTTLRMERLSDHQSGHCIRIAAATAFTTLLPATAFALCRKQPGASSPWFCSTAVWFLLRQPGFRPHAASSTSAVEKLPSTCTALARELLQAAQRQLGERLGILPVMHASGVALANAQAKSCLAAIIAPVLLSAEPLTLAEVAWCASHVADATPGMYAFAPVLGEVTVCATVIDDLMPLLAPGPTLAPGCTPATTAMRGFCASLLAAGARALAARFGLSNELHGIRHGVRYCIAARRWDIALEALGSVEHVRRRRDYASVLSELNALLESFDHAVAGMGVGDAPDDAPAIGLAALHAHLHLQHVRNADADAQQARSWWLVQQNAWPIASAAIKGAHPAAAGSFFDVLTPGERLYGIQTLPGPLSRIKRAQWAQSQRFEALPGTLMEAPRPPPSSPRFSSVPEAVLAARVPRNDRVSLAEAAEIAVASGEPPARDGPLVDSERSSRKLTVSQQLAAWMAAYLVPRHAVALLARLRAMRWCLEAHSLDVHGRVPSMLTQLLLSGPSGSLGRDMAMESVQAADSPERLVSPGTPLMLTRLSPPERMILPVQRIMLPGGPSVRVLCLALGPGAGDEPLLAVGCDDGVVLVFHAATGDPVASARASVAAAVAVLCWFDVESGALEQPSPALFAGCADGNTCVITLPEVKRGTVMRHVAATQLPGCGSLAVTAVSAAQGVLMSASLDSRLRFNDARSPHAALLAVPFDMTMGPLTCAAMHPRGDMAIVGALDGTARLVRLFPSLAAAGRRIMIRPPSPSVILRGHAVGVAVTCVACTPCGTRAVTGAADGACCVWDLSRGTLLAWAEPMQVKSSAGVTRPCGVTALDCSVRGDFVVTAARDGTFSLWRLPPSHRGVNTPPAMPLAPPLRLSPFAQQRGAPGAMLAVCFSKDMWRLVTACDAADAAGARLHMWEHAGHVQGPSAGAPGLHVVHGAQLVTDTLESGHLIPAVAPPLPRIISSSVTMPTEWDPPVGDDAEHSGCVTALAPLAWDPDVVFASASTTTSVHLWRSSPEGRLSRAEVVQLPAWPTNGSIHCLVGRDDALLVGGNDGRLTLLRSRHDAPVPTTLIMRGGHAGSVLCAAIAAEERAASGGEDGIVRVWSTDTSGALMASLRADHDRVCPPTRALTFGDDDASLLFSGGDDTQCSLWHVSVGVRISTWDAPSAVTALAVTPRAPAGMLVAGGTSGGEVLLWDCRSPQTAAQVMPPPLRACSVPRHAVPCGCIASLHFCPTQPAWLAACRGGHGIWIGDIRMLANRSLIDGNDPAPARARITVGTAPCVGIARDTTLTWCGSRLVVGDTAGRLRMLDATATP